METESIMSLFAELSTIVVDLGLTNSKLQGQLTEKCSTPQQLQPKPPKKPGQTAEQAPHQAPKLKAPTPPQATSDHLAPSPPDETRHRQKKRHKRQQKTFKLIISNPDSATLDAEAVMSRLLQTVNPVTSGFRIRNIRKMSGGKVLLETHDKCDMEKILQHPDLATQGLKAEIPVARAPRMIIYDVPAELADPGLRDAIWKQNPALQSVIPIEEFTRDFSPKFRIGDREAPHTK